MDNDFNRCHLIELILRGVHNYKDDWEILKDNKGNYHLIDYTGNSHIGTYNFERVCSSDNWKGLFADSNLEKNLLSVKYIRPEKKQAILDLL